MKKPHACRLLLVMLATMSLLSCASPDEQAAPNFLFIFTDDQGYDDLSHHGNLYLETPNLDQLAAGSVEFTNFHSAPLCAPSRAELLTGRQFLRTGVWGVHRGHDYLDLAETTFAEVLQANGYTTGMMGKWHSGHPDAWKPWSRGFDHAWVAELYQHGDCKLNYNGSMQYRGGWATDTLTTLAIEFMEAHKEGPFFCYLPYMSPHGQWRAPEAYVNKYLEKGQSLELATVNAMIDQIDVNVGRLMDYLNESGLDENTVVIFTTDNGPVQRTHGAPPNQMSDADWVRRNPSQLRGSKGTIWENGTRVPFFVRWAGKYRPGVVDRNAALIDMFPTILDIAGIELPPDNRPLDGLSLKPLFEGKVDGWEDRLLFIPKDEPYWKGREDRNSVLPSRSAILYENQVLTVRSQEFKLVKEYGKYSLFRIPEDPCEEKNVIEAYPEVAEELQKELRLWHEGIMASGISYTQPRFLIGEDGLKESYIYSCATVSLKGKVRGAALWTSDWWEQGDAQSLLVEVLTPGRYQFALDARVENPAAQVRLSIGEASLEARVDAAGFPLLGFLDLEQGAYELELRITGSEESEKPVFSRLSGIRVTKMK